MKPAYRRSRLHVLQWMPVAALAAVVAGVGGGMAMIGGQAIGFEDGGEDVQTIGSPGRPTARADHALADPRRPLVWMGAGK